MRDRLVQRDAMRLLPLAVAVLALTTCTSTPTARTGRVVMSQHEGWTIRVAPALTDRWRARVQVWPPDVNPQTHGGINLHFVESATDEKAIVQSGIASARRYIDATRRRD
jgi:hypothetical protein